jgi:hypothetical protein
MIGGLELPMQSWRMGNNADILPMEMLQLVISSCSSKLGSRGEMCTCEEDTFPLQFVISSCILLGSCDEMSFCEEDPSRLRNLTVLTEGSFI